MEVYNKCYLLMVLNFVFTSGKESVKTASGEDYTFAVIPPGMSRLIFKVKTDDAAHVSLSAGEDQDSAMYEIFIGEAKNTKTFIRRERIKAGGGKKLEQSVAATPQILSINELRGFWLSWSAESVQLGREGETSVLLEFKEVDPIKVTHYGCRTKWLSGEWEFEFVAVTVAPIVTSTNQIKDTTAQLNTLKASRDYNFIPVTSSSLLLRLKVAQDVYVVLSGRKEQDIPPFYELRLGKNKNKKSSISCDRSKDQDSKVVDVDDTDTPGLLSADEIRGFWITWDKSGSIKVGKQGQNDTFLNLTSPETFPISFFGIRVGSGVVEWNLQELSDRSTPFNALSHLEEISSILGSLVKLMNNYLSTDPAFKGLKPAVLNLISEDDVITENAEFAERLIKVVGEMRQIFTFECKKSEILEKDTEDDMKQMLKTVDGLLKYLYGDAEGQECNTPPTPNDKLTDELLQTVDQILKYFYDDPNSAVISASATFPVNLSLVKTVLNSSAIIDSNLVKNLVVNFSTITSSIFPPIASASAISVKPAIKSGVKTGAKKSGKDDDDDDEED